MRTYDMTVGGKDYQLRLTVDGQYHIEDKFPGERTLDILMSAPYDPKKCTAVLHEALRFKGNTNPSDVAGKDFYDKLVDEGFCGQIDFSRVMLGIGNASGLIKQERADAYLGKLEAAENAAFAEAEENPHNPSES